jgi:alkaline phosphatase D
MRYLSVVFILLLGHQHLAQVEILSGPMLVNCEMREVTMWLQLTDEATVSAEFWDIDNSENVMASDEVLAFKFSAHTAHLSCFPLEPGSSYEYQIIINGEVAMEGPDLRFTAQPLWQYQNVPVPEFTIAVGSCTYINEKRFDRAGSPYGGDYEIFESIANRSPNLMLWLGDNVYFKEADLYSRSAMMHRYTHCRSVPQIQRLLRSCHHYAIWDDHDFGPNNAVGSWSHKDDALETFEAFWANSNYSVAGLKGVTGNFIYGDAEFFLLDNRYYRTEHDIKGIEPTVLGEEQISWLIQALKYSSSRYKVVCIGGQFLSDLAEYENYARYPEERQRILDLISNNDIKGVVVLSGDRHHAELSSLELPSRNMIYELTTSPLTSTSYDHSDEVNSLRVKGTLYGERNFALLEFSNAEDTRILTIRLMGKNGQEVWNHRLVGFE